MTVKNDQNKGDWYLVTLPIILGFIAVAAIISFEAVKKNYLTLCSYSFGKGGCAWLEGCECEMRKRPVSYEEHNSLRRKLFAAELALDGSRAPKASKMMMCVSVDQAGDRGMLSDCDNVDGRWKCKCRID